MTGGIDDIIGQTRNDSTAPIVVPTAGIKTKRPSGILDEVFDPVIDRLRQPVPTYYTIEQRDRREADIEFLTQLKQQLSDMINKDINNFEWEHSQYETFDRFQVVGILKKLFFGEHEK